MITTVVNSVTYQAPAPRNGSQNSAYEEAVPAPGDCDD